MIGLRNISDYCPHLITLKNSFEQNAFNCFEALEVYLLRDRF